VTPAVSEQMFSAREAPCIVVVCLTILARWLLLGNDGAVSRGAAIEIIVRTLTRKLRVQGTVQVVHPGFGMGVNFGRPLFVNRFLEVLERQPQACFEIDLRLPTQKSSSLGDIRPPLLRIVLRQRFVPDFALRSGNRQHTVRTS